MSPASDAATQVTRAAWPERDGALRSPLLEGHGLVAGFTTRALGAMAGTLAVAEEQRRNRGALTRLLGFEDVVRVRQVHGAAVVHADAPFDVWPEADGIWTERPGLLLGVGGADCVPVLVADPQSLIGAAHAGWQGTTLRVTEALVDAMVQAGASQQRMVAALGPSIGPCCYTIDEERAALVRERLGPAAIEGNAFDLWRANAAQLAGRGVRAIEVSGICTRCGGADLWSYRARHERGPQGTALGFIGRPA
ncbi:MAG: polyphenol oxidase family protein [Chloroflexi bacterium]|nr:polyphenol oxidase family protein [Chloroflexota bacterium]